MKPLNTEEMSKITNLRTGKDTVVRGQVWFRIDAFEYKVSPYGLQGDYDKSSYFVSRDEVKEMVEFAKSPEFALYNK